MGNEMSSEHQIRYLTENSDFDEREIRRLHRRFKKIDTDQSGDLSVEEFMAIPRLLHNPLVKRVIDIFDTDRNGQIDFNEFILSISIFTSKNLAGQSAEKLDFMFKIYDYNNDGFISNGDLFQVLKIMVGENLTEVQLQQLVDRTIAQGDEDLDGKLSKEEFGKMVMHSNIEQTLTLNL